MSRQSDAEKARRVVNRLDGLLRVWADWTEDERAKPADDLVLSTIASLATASLAVLPREYGDDLPFIALSKVSITSDIGRDESDENPARLRVRQVQQYVTLMLDALVAEFDLESSGLPPSSASQPHPVVTARINDVGKRKGSQTRSRSDDVDMQTHPRDP